MPATRSSPNKGTPSGERASRLAAFIQLDPIAQSREIRLGLEPNIIGLVASEVLNTSTQSLLASLRIPSSTVTRKLAAGDRLSSGESDRVSRVILIHAHAADVFESGELAAKWMQTPHAELGGESPVSMLDTQAGYDEVQRILQRIEFGVGV
ncbi:type II RES/Xre toxin-antitoxin system antitoxin [Caballeronia grimmiae]|uniref:type II RES/Xre toxin-antitoxin system antitoxin n=1 Tax=Caballeronia grimmiae TaxID=1071679 RepID=UPI0038BDCD3B